MQEYIIVSAVGFRFRGFQPTDATGQEMYLKPEPTNEYDRNAVQLLKKTDGTDQHIAYISGKNCQQVHQFLNKHSSYKIECFDTFPQSAQIIISAISE